MSPNMGFFLACLLLLAGITAAFAQTDPPVPTIMVGESVTFTWVQDPVCTNGAPITDCPVTGYHVQIEREQSLTNWTNVSSVPFASTARSYTWIANGRGTTCFRVNVLNGAAYEATGPSNIKCLVVLVPLKPGTKAPTLTSSKDPQ
jgi:hypothetical protein